MERFLRHLNLAPQEAYATFNMGIGLVIATDQPDLVLSTVEDAGIQAWDIGYIEKGTGQIQISAANVDQTIVLPEI